MEILYRYIRVYGLAAGLMYFIRNSINGNLKIALPNYKGRFLLRKGTTDFKIFKQAFLDDDFNLPFGFEPEFIVDAGANIGFTAVYFANRFPRAKIISIEPEHSNFQVLVSNTRAYPNIIPVYKALSNKSQSLQVVDKGYGHWGFMTEEVLNTEGGDHKNRIETITIPEIMEQYRLTHIDIVKIDIEGFEKELFESNYEQWIPRTRCLIIELHDRIKPGCSKSFFSAIINYNFDCYARDVNLIFVNKDLEIKLTD